MQHKEDGKFHHKIRLSDGSTFEYWDDYSTPDWPGTFFTCTSRYGTMRMINKDHVIYIETIEADKDTEF